MKLRATGAAPELWWAASGKIDKPALYAQDAEGTRLSIPLGPNESVFVVFRGERPAGGIVSVSRDGQTLVDLARPIAQPETVASKGASVNFTVAVWVRPQADTPLPKEQNQGIHGLQDARNDVLFPPHGDTFAGGGTHAGFGLAMGRNGVCVLEHGAAYFVPILVHPAKIDDWTHVAVVYRENRPTLYLNGKPVRTGLVGSRTVHAAPASAASGFRGEAGDLEVMAAALDDAAVQRLMGAMSRPGTRHPATAAEFTFAADGLLHGLFREAGRYMVRMADGTERRFDIAEIGAATAVEGEWEVTFAGKNGKTVFPALTDWAQHPDEAIRHYSGTATYRKQFVLPARRVGQRLFLDLGSVRDVATVKLNGRELGTLWMERWQTEITEAAQAGTNTLEVAVTNVWNNCLVGDLKLPAEKRRTFLTAATIRANSPLLPAGLLGPVIVRVAEERR